MLCMIDDAVTVGVRSSGDQQLSPSCQVVAHMMYLSLRIGSELKNYQRNSVASVIYLWRM